MLRKLVDIQYVRNDTVLGRGRFRVKGDVLELQPAHSETAYRVSFFGDEVEPITHFDPLTGEVLSRLDSITVFPATQYVTSKPTVERAVVELRAELEEQVRTFEAEGRMLEAHRIRQRTEYDLEMMQELGFCNGIENYSRILDGRPPGSAPHTLLDYFPSDFVVFVDESHQTVPQIGGMYEGDRSRKQTLVDFGFRLPSALDNRPLRFDEFLAKVPQLVLVSATPGAWELRHSTQIAEQLIRPTGIVDPEVELRPTRNQIDDLLNEIRQREERGERTLVTTLTKKMAEDLTDYLLEAGVRARYLHSEIDTLERIQIIRDLRLGEYDVLVGVNLLREGLDLPEVSLVAILDADKEGFLRGQTALIQTIGRAARQRERTRADVRRQAHRGDQYALEETDRRRARSSSPTTRSTGSRPTSISKGVSDIAEFLTLDAPHVPGALAPRQARSRGWTATSSRSSSSRSRRRCRPPPRSSASSTRRSSATRSRICAASCSRSTRSRADGQRRGKVRVAASTRCLLAPDVHLDRQGLLVGAVDEDTTRLVAPARARPAEARGGREDAGGSGSASDLELGPRDDGRLVDVAAEDQLGAGPGERGRAPRFARPAGASCCARARRAADGGPRPGGARPAGPLASRRSARSSSAAGTRPRW